MAPQPTQLADLQDPLARAYAKAWDEILSEQELLANNPLRFARRARLREMQSWVAEAMSELDDQAATWVAQRLPQAVALGGSVGAAEGGGSFVWNAVSEEAAQRLAQRLYTDLLKATTHVNETTKALVRAIGQDEALQKLIQSRTAQQAGKRMESILKSKAIHAITYADGSKHGLREYTQMAMRTVTAQAYNEGALNAAHATGVRYWEVFDGPGCGWVAHGDPTQALGRIVTRDEALGYPVSHPNCRRAFGARPDIKTKADLMKARGGQVTEGQVDAQLTQDADREARQARRARATARRSTKATKRAPGATKQARATKVANRRARATQRGRTGRRRGVG